QSADVSVVESTYFFMPFMTSPNGSSACSGQSDAHSPQSTPPMSIASEPAKPAPTAAPISSSKYGKCHLSGDSTTPSREMKKWALILRTWAPPRVCRGDSGGAGDDG